MIRRLSGILTLAFYLLSVVSAANAAVIVYVTSMDGPSEFPVNASPGTGTAQVDYDNVAHTMRVRATFSGLNGTTQAAHIHSPIPAVGDPLAGVATQTPSFSGFPIGVTSGSMDTTFDLTLASSWNAAYITAKGGTPALAEAAFFSEIEQGKAYFNIHSTFRNGGEIRGFLARVPEPAAITLVAIAASALGAVRRRK